MIEVSNISKQVTTTEGTLSILQQINLSLCRRREFGDCRPLWLGQVNLAGYSGWPGSA